MEADAAARTLFAFARMKPGGNAGALPQLEKYLRDLDGDVDCDSAVSQMFYGVQYPDYLFSLPMGAGKTFLMAAFIKLLSLDCTNGEGAWRSDAEIKIDAKGFVTRDGKKTKTFWDAKITSAQKPLRLKIRNIAGDESVLPLAWCATVGI